MLRSGKNEGFHVDISTDLITSCKLHPSNIPVVDRLVGITTPLNGHIFAALKISKNVLASSWI